MTPEERVLVEDLLFEYKSLVDFMRPNQSNHVYYPEEIARREAKIDGIRQSLSSILKCKISE